MLFIILVLILIVVLAMMLYKPATDSKQTSTPTGAYEPDMVMEMSQEPEPIM